MLKAGRFVYLRPKNVPLTISFASQSQSLTNFLQVFQFPFFLSTFPFVVNFLTTFLTLGFAAFIVWFKFDPYSHRKALSPLHQGNHLL